MKENQIHKIFEYFIALYGLSGPLLPLVLGRHHLIKNNLHKLIIANRTKPESIHSFTH
jgi:hypothetical protein